MKYSWLGGLKIIFHAFLILAAELCKVTIPTLLGLMRGYGRNGKELLLPKIYLSADKKRSDKRNMKNAEVITACDSGGVGGGGNGNSANLYFERNKGLFNFINSCYWKN